VLLKAVLSTFIKTTDTGNTFICACACAAWRVTSISHARDVTAWRDLMKTFWSSCQVPRRQVIVAVKRHAVLSHHHRRHYYQHQQQCLYIVCRSVMWSFISTWWWWWCRVVVEVYTVCFTATSVSRQLYVVSQQLYE